RSGKRGPLDENEEDTKVAKKGHTEEQILRALRQAESGTRVADICREHGISEATYYIWKKKYSGLGLSKLRELRQLREENAKHQAPGRRPVIGSAHLAGDRAKKEVSFVPAPMKNTPNSEHLIRILSTPCFTRKINPHR